MTYSILRYSSGVVFFSGEANDSLEEFTESLSKFTRFSGFRSLATLNYASDIYNTSSIVSRLGTEMCVCVCMSVCVCVCVCYEDI